MPFQIDPNIPLQAQRTTFDPYVYILMQAQQNAANLEKHRFEMQKLREDYEAQKKRVNNKKRCKWVSLVTGSYSKRYAWHNMRL